MFKLQAKHLIIIILPIIFISKIYAEKEIIVQEMNIDDMNEAYQDRTSVLERQIQYLVREIESLKNEVENIKQAYSNFTNSSSIINDNSSSNENRPNEEVFSSLNNDKSINHTSKTHNEASKNNSSSFTSESKDTLTSLKKKSAQEFYDTALKAFKNNDFSFSTAAFSSFISKYPNDSLLSNAYYWLGESYVKQNMLAKAALTYIKGSEAVPEGKKAIDSLLKAAECLGKMKRNSDCCNIINKITKNYPNRSIDVNKRIYELKDKYGCK